MGRIEKAAIYCRLSKEDKDKLNQGDESASIQNQKMLLVDYAIEHQFAIHEIYIDDDYTGLDSDRPAFNRLLQDAKNGLFHTIICKTQSRFTRDMELVEKYLHGLFPVLGIRFIGVADYADTNVKGNKKARQINGLINEWYCEDLSENIRCVFKAKMEKGQFLGSYAPYGYSKDPEDYHKLVIDEEAARVVQKIFSYAVQGLGNRQICDKLYEERIVTPTEYKKRQGYRYENPASDSGYGKSGIWGTSTIRKILSNRVYIGDMVQGREKKISYKSKKVVHLPESEWVIVTGCHESIVDKETYALVQELRKSRRYARTVSEDGVKQASLLAGKVRCKDCGSTLTRCNGDTKYVRLYCQLYKRTKKEQCSPHAIGYFSIINILDEKIRYMVKEHLQFNKVEEYLTFEQDNNRLYQNKNKELSKIEENLRRTKHALGSLYVDKTNQIISQEEYLLLKENLNQQLLESNQNFEKTRKELKDLLLLHESKEKKKDLIRKYADFEALNSEIVNEFIDFIEIGEKDDEKNQEVVIHWRF